VTLVAVAAERGGFLPWRTRSSWLACCFCRGRRRAGARG